MSETSKSQNAKPLQSTASSQYERPNLTWTNTDVSTPNDSEEFARRERSLRSKRGIFTLAVTAFIVGATMILLNSPYRNEFLAPGPLSSTHAQILAGHGADRCAACHGAGHQSLATWFADTLSGGRQVGACQSDLCMTCHQNSINGDYAMVAHNVDPARLAETTARLSEKQGNPFQLVSTALKSVPGVSAPVSGNEIACSACHREHHGGESLSALTDAQCQTCHGSKIHSFETDHPEFELWPVSRRSQIAFDHTSHGLKHFPGANTTFACAQCHIDDDVRDTKLLAPFEQSCAACHEKQILESSDRSLALFALPMLDLDAVNAAGACVGQWPELATGDFDGEIPGVMRMLLAADDQAVPMLAKFGNDFSFGDVDPDDSQMVSDACELVWSIKRLLNDLAKNGNLAIRRRLETVLGRSLTQDELAELMAGLNANVFEDAAARWIPELGSEMLAVDAGLLKPRTRALADLADRDVSFKFAPAQDVADDRVLAVNPLKGRVTPGSVQPSSSNRPVTPAGQPVQPGFETSGSSQNTALNGDGRLNPADEAAVQGNRIVNRFSDEGEANFLTKNPLKTLMGGGINGPDQMPQINSGPSTVVTQPDSNHPESTPAHVPATVPKFNPDEFSIVASSGWVRNDLTLQVGYRPSGHADRMISRWTTLVTGLEHADSRFETASLFEQLTNPLGIGNCRSCHTVDQSGDAFEVNWTGKKPDRAFREFTKFSHGPHLVQPHLRDCSHCHTLNAKATSADTFVGFDSTIAVTNFHPVVKANCATCHQEGQTDNSCTHCHNYHVGGVPVFPGLSGASALYDVSDLPQ